MSTRAAYSVLEFVDLPAVTGLIVGLHLQLTKYEYVGGILSPVDHPSTLRSIWTSPKWFANSMDSTGWVETGVLMDLAVTRR